MTAKHVLFGHGFDEHPLEKQVHLERGLSTLGELQASRIVEDQELDLAAVHVNGFPSERCLPYTALRFNEAPPPAISIVGFLARDFRRSGEQGVLRPKPYAYTGTRMDIGEQYVGITHPRRGRITGTRKIEMAPIPRGLSGTVMLSPTALLRNKVEIFGVFTEQRLEQAFVFGAHVAALRPLLDGLVGE